jgi:hypothetical protein
MYVDPRMADASYRQRTWQHLAECTARGEQLRAEADQAIREAGAQVGEWVRLSPFLTGQVVQISGSPPMAEVVSEVPTGRRGETGHRSEWKRLDGLQVVEQQGLQQAPESLFLPEATAALFDAGINSPESESDSTDTCTI